MKLDYTVMNPTGNITIFVDTPFPQHLHSSAAAKLLQTEPMAEQVGFLTGEPGCDISVRMAGGEFCGNACMAAAALFVRRGGKAGRISVKISGCTSPVEVEISPAGSGYNGRVAMPAPLAVTTAVLPHSGSETRLPLVDFGGITHLVDTSGVLRGEVTKETIRSWCELLGADALGVMRYDPVFSSMEPLVYVSGIDTLYYERSCGSGTSALGAVLALERRTEIRAAVREPGGTLTVEASPDGRIFLSGRVNLLCSKTIEYEEQ